LRKVDPSTEKGRAEEVSSVTGGGAIPPRFPADAQTLPLLEADDVEVAAAAALVVMVVVVVLALVFLVLSLVFLAAVVSAATAAAAVVVAASAGAGAGAGAAEVVTALLPAATLHHQLTSHFGTSTPTESLLQ
jgi:hypothetical protein